MLREQLVEGERFKRGDQEQLLRRVKRGDSLHYGWERLPSGVKMLADVERYHCFIHLVVSTETAMERVSRFLRVELHRSDHASRQFERSREQHRVLEVNMLMQIFFHVA